eukprot:SAG22_NODE_7607_length_724_cov_3.267200_1_plen_87_part_10
MALSFCCAATRIGSKFKTVPFLVVRLPQAASGFFGKKKKEEPKKKQLAAAAAADPVRQRSSLLKAVITAFPCVSLPFLAVPLRSQRT